MELAIWNTPAAEFLLSGLQSGVTDIPVSVHRASPRRCVELLMEGLVDVAMVPSLVAYSNPKELEVLSGVALSSWNYPYAKLALFEGLQDVGAMAFNPEDVQEALLARIVLKEHYACVPELIEVPEADSAALLAQDQSASLLVGDDVPLMQSDALLLDLGQEWYELANYPMVWALFATRKEQALPKYIHTLVALRHAAEAYRAKWVQAREMPPDLHQFYIDDLRLSFDDLVVASLTEFGQYLYYYGVTPEVTDLPVYSIPTEEEEGDDASSFL